MDLCARRTWRISSSPLECGGTASDAALSNGEEGRKWTVYQQYIMSLIAMQAASSSDGHCLCFAHACFDGQLLSYFCLVDLALCLLLVNCLSILLS